MNATGTPPTFLRLRETPDSYAGQSGKVASVKSSEDGLEFTTPSGVSGLTGVTSQVTGSDVTISTTAVTDITGLTFATAANKFYEVDVMLRMQNSNAAAHHWAITHSTALATGSITFVTGTNSTATSVAINVAGVISAPNTCQVATTDMMVWIKGIVITGANAGNITVQSQRDGAGTTTIYIGSRMTVYTLA